MYDGTFTEPGGIHGLIGELGSPAEIGLAEIRHGARVDEALQVARQSGNHKGIVAVTVASGRG